MASIENRSRYVVTVQNRDELAKTFACNREADLKAYIAHLKAHGYKAKLSRTNDNYVVRVREAGKTKQTLPARSEQEAIDIKQRIELERRNGLFVDYSKGRSVTFGDLLARYLREESPRHKGFEVEGYIINAMLADAGLPRVDLADAFAEHKNPHPSLAGRNFRRQPGKRVRLPAPATCFIRKPFADVVPEDIHDYIDDRCQAVGPDTVDREVDLFSAVCHMAIDSWRIPVAKSPMDGVRRPKYFNERDRRLKGNEEERLLNAAYDEDAQAAIKSRLEELMGAEREQSAAARSSYQRKAIVKTARERHLAEAETTYTHVPWTEAFIQFQLMTGARISETLSIRRVDVDFDDQTAFITETKNGRPRELALREDLIKLLRQLPDTSEALFPMSVDAVRKAWNRICLAADLVGENELRIHDLRHEAISRIAEAGSKLPGGFSLADLQALSGHRDTRMLLRYTHLCMPSLAKRLDMAFADATQTTVHRGQRRLKKGAGLTMKALVDGTAAQAVDPMPTPPKQEALAIKREPPSNVVQFRPRKMA